MQTILYILPEIFLSLSIMILLMIGVFVDKSYKLINLLVVIIMFFTIALVISQPDQTIKVFDNSFIIDKLSSYMKILTLLFCSFVLILSQDYIKINNINKIEYPIIILASVLGMMLMISSYDLIVF